MPDNSTTAPPQPSSTTVSLWTPVVYLAVLLSALVIFSNRHRKHKRDKLAATKQLYEYNFAREIYEHLESEEKTVPRKLTIAALLAIAVENFTRMLKYKENEPIMNNLLQSGVIGEDFYERFTGSTALNERELQELAQAFATINYPFPQAIKTTQEVTQQFAMRKRLEGMQDLKSEYREMLGDLKPRSVLKDFLPRN